jgi:hypothetical protein
VATFHDCVEFGGEDHFDRHHPVIAWEVEHCDDLFFTRPIVPSFLGDVCFYETEFGEVWALKSPEGKYYAPDEVFDNEADALAWFVEDRDKRIEAELADSPLDHPRLD